MHPRSPLRTVALSAVASALIASTATGAVRHEPSCRQRWFLPSFTYTVHARSIRVNGSYTYVGRLGAMCHIPTSRPYNVELLVLGRGGYNLVAPSNTSFAGDVPAGGGGAAGVTVPLRTWCRHQPVELKLLGAGPVWPPPSVHRLVLQGIRIGC